MKFQTGSIILNRLRCHAYHGVLPQERVTGGEYVVTLKAQCNMEQAMHSDCLDHAVNYATVADIVRREMAVPSALLEHVAGRIGESLFSELPQIRQVWLTIEKLNPPIGADIESAAVKVCLINDKTT